MPAAQALGCSACGRAITPCLVCAFPIPVATSEREIFGSKSCGKCGVLNPVGVKNRFLLGFPPALALPPAVVRRAQVARVGRMAYTLAKHAHYVHLRALLQGRKEFDIQEEEAAGEEPLAIEETDSIDTAHPTSFEDLDLESSNPSVPEVYASPQEGLPLRFLPYLQDWRLQEGGIWKNVMAMEACRCNPLPDSEPPSKRMFCPTLLFWSGHFFNILMLMLPL